MILSLVLIIGCALWAAGDILMVAAGTITPAAGWTATLGLYVAGAGLFALKDLPAMVRPGRVGIVLSAFGAFSFATVFTIVLTAGTLGAMAEGSVRHADMVLTPFYLLAWLFAVSGLVALAIHFRAARSPRWAFAGAVVLAVATAMRVVLAIAALLSAAVPDLVVYHEVVSGLVAVYFGWLGVVTLRRQKPARAT